MTDEPTGIDIADVKPCPICAKPLGHDNNIQFVDVSIAQHVFDLNNLQRLQGLAMMMGSVELGRVFAPSTRVSTQVEPPKTAYLCLPCAATTPVWLVLEKLAEEQADG